MKKINWELPAPRKGFYGIIDKLIGPGATTAEQNLQLYIPFLATVVIVGIGLYNNYEWTIGQYIVASFFALDMVGGVITNLTSTAKRWNFRAGNGLKSHLFFVSIHIIQLTLASYFFLDFDLVWIGVIYGFLMVASFIILISPLYLQRPVSGIMYCIALSLSLYLFESPTHLEWFLPLFFFKLLISHVVQEEPYRPANED